MIRGTWQRHEFTEHEADGGWLHREAVSQKTTLLLLLQMDFIDWKIDQSLTCPSWCVWSLGFIDDGDIMLVN